MLMNFNCLFLCPRDRRSGAYWCCPVCHSVIPLFCHSRWNLNLAYNLWTMNARALIFHMNITCDKTLFFETVTLTLSLTHFLKTLTLLITFEQWVPELWYFIWVFLVIIPFHGYHYFWHLDLGVWPILWKL